MSISSGPLKPTQASVEAAIKALAATRITTKSDAMLRTFLAFKAIHRDGVVGKVDTPTLKAVVAELFTVLPTPNGVDDSDFKGTIALRGDINGKPVWLANDSYRGAFLDYAGPTSQGRFLFEDDDWRNPLKADAVDIVAATLGAGSRTWPPAEALAVLALRNEAAESGAAGTEEMIARARERFGLTEEEWDKVTSRKDLAIDAHRQDAWNPDSLAPDLGPPGAEHATIARAGLNELPSHLESEVARVLAALAKHGQHAIVALAGVPGTSKSYVARIAARTFASEGCLREVQFSPGYTYEEFMEGPRYGPEMAVEIVRGAFLNLNKSALEDPGHQYVLLIEEFTRADLPRVLGELLTYVEYRGEGNPFTTMYRRNETTTIASNIAILATYNPSDRSAVSVDAALLRRMRILDFPPNTVLLAEILTANGVDDSVIAALVEMFDACREIAGSDRYEEVMPFGHAVFSSVVNEADLYELWHEELKRMLVRPHAPRHELYDTVLEHYPWHDSASVTVVSQGEEPPGSAQRGLQ